VVVLLHGLHIGVIAVGTAVVLALIGLGRGRPQRRALDELRAAASSGSLVELARLRAERMLAGADPAVQELRRRLLVGNALACVAAGAIHAGVAPEHFHEGPRFGLFFVLLSAAQFVTAAVLLVRPSYRLVVAAVAMNSGVVALWAITRTIGLPFGLADVETVGRLDAVATIAEVAAAWCCLAWIARPSLTARPIAELRRPLSTDGG
jgi:hypothetical protein